MANRVFIIGGAAALVLAVLAIVIFAGSWADTVPAWLSGVGGILGALASLYAISIAVQAGTEHVSWSKVVTKTSLKGTPSRFEFVNVSKATIAQVVAVLETTGDIGDAMEFSLELPIEVAPGASFPIGVSRTLANASPTIVTVEWRERPFTKKSFGKTLHSQVLYI